MKALIISIGTGVGPSDEAVNSLASGITYSIRNSNPDKVLFVVSRASVEKTLPRILKDVNMVHEVICIEDPEDINKIYEDLSAKFNDMKKNCDHITVDFTSGTKAMSAALAILGSVYEVDVLSYVTGKRFGGTVQKGTERVLSIQPYTAVVERSLRQAAALFNKCQFDGCLIMLGELVARIGDPELKARIAPLQNATSAYSAWEKFDHQTAFQRLKEVKFSQFDRNKAFLGRLLNESERDPYLIADLISNAKRRGEIEHKYDDAVARLYRTIELIAQWRLKQYRIADTENVPKEKIPSQLIKEWKLVDDKAKIGLRRAYQLLAALNDALGQAFLQDERVRDLLQRRNLSILAHGLTPVTTADYEQLRDVVVGYARKAVPNLDNLVEQAALASWPE